MTQTAIATPAVEVKTCATCPHFNNFNEPIGYADSTAKGRRNAPAFGRGWCQLFDHCAREHHEITGDCVINSETDSTNTKERELITIEFAPKIHPEETEYNYPHPLFVFGDRVLLTDSFPDLEYAVCALELIESKTASGRLLNQPRWKYKVTDSEGNNFWKEESALTRCTQKTGSAKISYKKINDWIINGALSESELDKPRAGYEIGSRVKVIDAKDHHTEWEVFEIVEQKYNGELFDDAESYLNQPEWFYKLANADGENTFEPIWVRENEICHFDQSHNICTNEVF